MGNFNLSYVYSLVKNTVQYGVQLYEEVKEYCNDADHPATDWCSGRESSLIVFEVFCVWGGV